MTTHRALWVAAGLLAGFAPALRAQAELKAIHGSSPTDIWVVGDAPAALHHAIEHGVDGQVLAHRQAVGQVDIG